MLAGNWPTALLACVALGGVWSGAATAQERESSSEAHAAPQTMPSSNPLERRVKLLAQELGLDARQQAQLRAILVYQREAVSRIWTDPDLLPAERGPATRAVEQHTADRIRAMLSDEQKKKYNPPPPDKAVTAGLSAGAGGPDVEKWLKAAQAHNAGAGASQ